MSVIIGFLSVIFVIWIVLMIEEAFTRTSKRERDLQNHVNILLDRAEREKRRKEINDLYVTNTNEDISTIVPDTMDSTDCMYMSAIAKQTYMQSPEWKVLKDQRLKLANHKCESCGSTSNLHLHHIDYSTLGCEDISHVRILCKQCHQAQHDHYGMSRETIYLPIIRG